MVHGIVANRRRIHKTVNTSFFRPAKRCNFMDFIDFVLAQSLSRQNGVEKHKNQWFDTKILSLEQSMKLKENVDKAPKTAFQWKV